jgi:hypothetical protein
MTDETKKRDKLIDLYDEAEKINEPLLKETQEAVKKVQQDRDTTRVVRKLIESAPNDAALPPETWDRLIKSRQQQNDATRTFRYGMSEIISDYSPTSTANVAVSSATVSAVAAHPPVDIILQGQKTRAQPWVTFPPSALKAAIEGLNVILDRARLYEQIKDAIRRLKLNTALPGQRDLYQLLDESQAAVEKPSAEMSSLHGAELPIRQCIWDAITELLRRCPNQAPTKKWPSKVLAIGEQCGKQNLPPGYFELLAADVLVKLGELAGGGKTNAQSRDQMLLLVNDGLQFLLALLEGVDEKRLRPAS